MSRKKVKGKGAGKVVKVRKVRRSPLATPTTRRVLVIALATVLAISAYAVLSTHGIGGGSGSTLSPYEIIKLLAEGENTSINVALVYDVMGDVVIGNGTIVNVYDKIILTIQPGRSEIPINKTIDNETVESTEVIKYYIVRYDSTPYLTYYALSKLGTSPIADNLSELMVNKKALLSSYDDVKVRDLGGLTLRNEVLGNVTVTVREIQYNSISIKEFNEVMYGLPIEVVVSEKGCELRLRLSGVITI